MVKDKKQSNGGAPMRAPATTDPRFARLHTDPRFLRPKKEDTKVVVDDRFKDLLQGVANGKPKRKTDKYGRKIAKGESEVDQMRRFYRLDEGEEEDQEKEDKVVDYARGEGDLDSSSDENSSDQGESDSEEDNSSDDDEDVMIGSSKVLERERKRAAALSDDDDIGEIDLDEDEAEEVYAQLDAEAQRAIELGEGIQDVDSADEAESSRKGKGKAKSKQEKIPTGDDSARLAVVNMDWDHVRSKDLYKVFSSLISPTGSVSSSKKVGAHGAAISQVRGQLLHVRIYPSDFGKERMAKEDVEGPPRDIFKKKKSGNNDDSDEEINEKTIIQVDEGGEFDEEALRKYQLDRLRYYYAVATFDSKETARHVYNEIDGTEMERTANVFDLRFIPDGMEFPDGQEGRNSEFRDEATEDVTNYKGVDFRTDALRHSKVKLTWDQDDPERSKLTRMVSRGGLTKEQLRDDDFKAYLASATESEGEEEDEQETNKAGRDRLRALLNFDDAPKGRGKRNGGVFDDGNDGEEQGDMEITFLPGLSEAAARKSRGEKADSEDETTIDKYKRKLKEKKEKRKYKKAEADSDEDEQPVADNAAAAGFNDPFFASDNDMDMEAAMAAELDEAPKPKKAGKKDKKSKQPQPDLDPKESARQRAELQLLVGNESDDERTRDGRQHFDLKDIIRAESGKDAKKAKMLRRLSKKKQRQEEDFQARKGKPLVQNEFEIDTKDQRFAAVLEDHMFAIDPSHPGFVKTNAMKQLMQERRKRQDESNPESGKRTEKKDQKKDRDDDITSLVNKLKRRSGEQPAQPKKSKA